MTQHKRIHKESAEELEEVSRRNKKAQQPLYDRLKSSAEGTVPATGFLGESSIERHVALLADVHSEQQANLITQLQQSHGNAHVQRVMERIQEKRGSGQSLESDTRFEMETAFKQDFSDVRIHTDAAANQVANELGANAVASGKDIFFSEGTYQTGSDVGKALLAHELTHVVQQESNTEDSNISIGRIGDVFEQEADLISRDLIEGCEISVEMASAVPSLQLDAPEATAEAPAAEPGADEAARVALRAMWDAVVVGNVQGAQEALQEEPPDFQTAHDNFVTVSEIVMSVAQPYRQNEPLYFRFGSLHGIITRVIREIQPHLGQTAPVEEILDAFEPIETYTTAIRELM